MNFFMVLRVALRALMRSKARSFLTMLGIIVGIAAVIAVIAVGHGATVMVQEQIKSMGDNILMISPGSASRGHFHFGAGTRQTLTAEDAKAILQDCLYVKAASPFVRANGQLVYQEKNWHTSINGISPSYLEISNWDLSEGSFFTEADVRGATKVCVIGSSVCKEIFNNEDPLGKFIRIRKVPIKVLGVLKSKGSNTWGRDQDDVVMMPWSTVRRVIQKSPFNNVDRLVMSLVSMDILDVAQKEIRAILRERHRLAPQIEDDFSMRDMTELTERFTATSRLMTMLLTIIASISLIVGGIGIMNIMLVSVTERTREIGLRMAVGARGQDVLLQFLVEAIVLAGIGGILGILLGAAVAEIISRANNWPVLVSSGSVLLAFTFSASIGIFFGFYPAMKASRLDPIEALRYE